MSQKVVCTDCNLPKDQSNYYFDKTKNGYKKYCKSCSTKRCMRNTARKKIQKEIDDEAVPATQMQKINELKSMFPSIYAKKSKFDQMIAKFEPK